MQSMDESVWDIIIIGAGTAGLTASIYARRAGRSALVLESSAYGGLIVKTPDIENYPGMKHVSGFDYATKLYDQAIELGAKVEFATVTSVEDNGETKTVVADGKRYVGKTVIIATGARNRHLDAERADEMVGRGVSYCATCDGMFFRGKDVAVVGGGNTAVEDALYLTNVANKVYLIHRRDTFRGEPENIRKLHELPNVEFVTPARVDELFGDQVLEAISVTNTETGEKRRIPVSGLFVAIGRVPDNTAFAQVVDLDDRGYVISGEDCTTRTPGVFVAGDCRTKQVRQLVTAAADGAVAATAASAYIG